MLAYLLLTAASFYAINIRHESGNAYQISLLVPFFAAGAVLYKFADVVVFSWQLGTLSIILITALCFLGAGQTLIGLPMAYLLIWISAVAPGWLKGLGSKNDYSYGMYLYGMPVQQMLVAVGVHRAGALTFLAISILATFPLAAFSWWVIEKPSMRLKNVGLPRRFSRGLPVVRSRVGLGKPRNR